MWRNHPVRLHLKTINMAALSKFHNYPKWGSPECDKLQFVAMLNTFVFNHRKSKVFPDLSHMGLELLPHTFVTDDNLPCVRILRTVASPRSVFVMLWPMKCNIWKISQFWRAFSPAQDKKNPGCSKYATWAYDSVQPPLHEKIWDICDPHDDVYVYGHSVMSEVALIFAHHSIVHTKIQPSRLTVFASGCLPTFTPSAWKTMQGANITEIINTCDAFANRLISKMIRGPRQYIFTDNFQCHGRANISDCHTNAAYVENIVQNNGKLINCVFPH